MKEIGQIIRNKRLEKNFSVSEFAELIEVSHPYISNIENNKLKTPPSNETLMKIADVLSMSEEERSNLLELAALERTPDIIKQKLEKLIHAAKRGAAIEAMPNQVDMIKMPVYSGVRAGANGVICYGEIVGYEYFPQMKNAENKFNIKVYGNSMEPMIPDKATVTINIQQDLDNGQIGVFVINGDEGIVKKFYREDKFIRLVSLNSEYNDLIILPGEEFVIAGKVIRVSYNLQ